MTIVPRDPQSEVVDKKQKIMPDWYSWFNELTGVANSAAPSGGGGLSPPFVIPADFGVVADGSTDDTVALNAMFASLVGTSAIVLWPKTGFCRTTDTVTVGLFNGDPNGPSTHVSIQGVGTTENCGIRYDGPNDREILRFAKCTNFFINDFNLHTTFPSHFASPGARGSSVGISLSGNGFANDANQCSNFVFSRVNVFRCNIGIRMGGNGACASEGTFIHTAMAENDYGFTAVGLNSLDFQFIQLLGGFNGFLIDTGTGNGVNVFGGSSTGNECCFGVQGNATMEIISFRSEDEPKFMTGSGGRVTLQGCAISNTPSPFIAIDGYYSSLIIRDCIVLGAVSLTGNAPNYVEMTGNYLRHWDTVHKLPMFLPTLFNILICKVDLRNNFDHDFPGSPIPDTVGNLGARGSPIGTRVFYEPNITRVPIDKSGVPNFGVEYLALSHVRQLSESTIKGATTDVAPLPGQNLRVSGKLTAGTLALTFKRNLTISGTGDPTITATLGTSWFPTDAGKPLVVPVSVNSQTEDFYGYVTDYISPTQVNVFPGSFTHNSEQPQGVNKPATIGADEPDANYIVAGICGDAIPPESYSVTAKTSTGFTITSSNGASTALVTALIVR